MQQGNSVGSLTSITLVSTHLPGTIRLLHNNWSAEATHLECLLNLDKNAGLQMASPPEMAILHAKPVGLDKQHLE